MKYTVPGVYSSLRLWMFNYIYNSRPLTYVTDDVEDLKPLTAAMFLQDVKEVGVPELDQIDENKLNKRLVYRNRIRKDLRKLFRVEYLGQLRVTRNIKEENTKVKEILFWWEMTKPKD
ncbi:integrase catalytic domain-containing protein [Trichonephila clavipes]|nr:integrase catalytic domain-containing protein [Trichonephila clavipes]